MKRIFYLLLVSAALISCQSHTQPAVQGKSQKVSAQQSGQYIKEYAPVIHGVWVKADYIDKVTQTRSTVAAADKVTGITIMAIDTSRLDSDSLRIKVGYDNYQGGEIIMKFHPGKIKGTIPFNADALGYTIQNNDTTLTLYQYYQNVLYKTNYIKVLRSQPDNNISFGMNYIINKKLIAGNYQLMGNTPRPLRVVFNSDGTISGLGKYKTYNVESDRKREPMTNLDEITFGQYSSAQKSYAFKIEQNTLNLYETKPNADSSLLLIDKLKYKLVRVGSR